MVNTDTARFSLLRGQIADLVTSSGEEEFVQTTADKALGSGLAATLALSGLAGAATGAMLATSGSADSVQFFTCTVNGKRIAGRFSKVWFENGDHVEVIGEPHHDESIAAYAIRRPSDRTLWMFPHSSRGRKTHWAYAWKAVPIAILGMQLFFVLAMGLMELLSDREASNDALWFFFWLMAVNSIAIGLYFPLKIGRKWRPFVAIAEKVFAALGYSDPSRVDMEKQNSLYWKKHAKPGEQRKVAPWVFRYVDEK
jgi:hypothetical protein